ncbi:MarR family protein [Roseovarius tolerans]|uniref:MarR family protein n=1 Tax=Roseovarius tolerans TaxID=74031 RepID=A0A0L6CTA6_9RHOB|nr:MarR family transcriptional regulator [Roseovarius tolerans]KNX40753.1 MarR family protein [Roseovarius tolerans]
MTYTSSCSDEIAELLIHIGRSSRGEDLASPLTAAQWTCLRFFARANRVSRTPSAFASFQVTTRGTASQTIKTLEEKGLLARFRSDSDGRSVRLEITEQGHETLKADPLADLMSVIDVIKPKERAAFLATLSHLSETLAGLRGAQAFGTCEACTHYAPSDAGGYCACIAAELAPDDFGKLCVNFGSGGILSLLPGPSNEIGKG